MTKAILTAVLFGIIGSGLSLPPRICSALDTTGTAPQLNLEIPLPDNLMAFKGKTLTVTVSSGQSITGIVKNVRNGLLHLEKLSQKEFFDAVIVIDKIVAVEVRVK